MAGLLKIKDLEARRRALAAESEVYRETLRLEVQNLRLYSVQIRRKWTRLSAANPLLLWAAPIVGSFLRERRKSNSPWRRFLPITLIVLPLLKRMLPVLATRIAASMWDRRTAGARVVTPSE